MLNLLIKPLLGVAGEVVTGIVETKKKKAEVKLKKIEAEAAHMDKIIAGKAEWETEAAKQMSGSWKDELSLVVLFFQQFLYLFLVAKILLRVVLLHCKSYQLTTKIFYTLPSQLALELRGLVLQLKCLKNDLDPNSNDVVRG